MGRLTMLELPVMLLRELISPPRLQRRPEPSAEMDDLAQVEAFHGQGANALVPVYHFNALATSRMVPVGGTVVDLGSGSGRYLSYLAQRRPDIRIIGIDLAPTMVEVGNRFLAQQGLAGRVTLKVGDMTSFGALLPEPVDLISSVFSLHHLPTEEHLKSCLSEIAAARQRTGCGMWLFDHARPRHPATPQIFPEIFTPDAPNAFKQDSCNSLIASHSFAELCEHLHGVGLEATHHRLSRWMRLYQVHWLEPAQVSKPGGAWQDAALLSKAQHDYTGLRRLFPDVPQ